MRWNGMALAVILAALPMSADAQPAQQQPLELERGSVAAEKDLARHIAFLKRKEQLIQTGGTELVFIGDSITDGWRADPQREIFEDYFGGYRPYNIGISGDETQHVLWRVQHGELDGIAPKLAVVMIGTNNLGNTKMTPAETAKGVATLIAAIRAKQPRGKILLLGIFPRGNRIDNPLRELVNTTNNALAKLADNQSVFFLDIGKNFVGEDGALSGSIMPDYLHPNAQGYQIWASAIKPTVDRLEK
jgi:lysophospholipase L1-like esterase